MIRFDGVSKRFAADGAAAVDDVSLDVARGELFGVIGASGAGKSTLLRLVNALERPSAGRVLVAGEEVSALHGAALRRVRRRIGMIFQGFGLLGSASVADNVAMPLRLAGVDAGERDAQVATLLDRVGLRGFEARYPAQLSGGQKQRVGIARALATRPDVLLCDEPTSALDPATTAQVLALLRELNRELGLTVMLITHEMDVVRRICDRVAVMAAGRVVESGSTADVLLRPRHDATRRMLGESEAPVAMLSEGERLVRLTRRGGAADPPVDAGRIVEGRIGRIGDETYSQLLLAVREEDVARLAATGTVDPL